MKRPSEIRSPPKEWIKILATAYPFFKERRSVGDLVLYGSQALSIYMKNPLRSKDLDLLSAQVGYEQMEELSAELSKLANVESWSTSVDTRPFGARKMRTYAVELRVAGRPFFIELFNKILDGRSLSLLESYLTIKKQWGLEMWVPEREATLALRLAFRPPEGISRLNATRLNSFIRENQWSLRFSRVASIVRDWEIEEWVEKNLIDLYRRNRLRIIGDNKIVPGIERKLG